MNYLQDLKNSTIHPQRFFKKPLKYSYRQSLSYYLFIFLLTMTINYLAQMLQTQRAYAPFIAINQAILSLPLALLGLFILAAVIYLLSKLLGGQGSFKQTFALTVFSEALIIVTPIPVVKVLWLYSLYLLVLSLKNTHQYGWTKAVLVVTIPNLILLLFTEMLKIPGSIY